MKEMINSSAEILSRINAVSTWDELMRVVHSNETRLIYFCNMFTSNTRNERIKCQARRLMRKAGWEECRDFLDSCPVSNEDYWLARYHDAILEYKRVRTLAEAKECLKHIVRANSVFWDHPEMGGVFVAELPEHGEDNTIFYLTRNIMFPEVFSITPYMYTESGWRIYTMDDNRNDMSETFREQFKVLVEKVRQLCRHSTHECFKCPLYLHSHCAAHLHESIFDVDTLITNVADCAQLQIDETFKAELAALAKDANEICKQVCKREYRPCIHCILRDDNRGCGCILRTKHIDIDSILDAIVEWRKSKNPIVDRRKFSGGRKE